MLVGQNLLRNVGWKPKLASWNLKYTKSARKAGSDECRKNEWTLFGNPTRERGIYQVFLAHQRVDLVRLVTRSVSEDNVNRN